MSSVRTPRSKISMASTIASTVKQQEWSKYRAKSKIPVSGDSIFKSNELVAGSADRGRNGRQSYVSQRPPPPTQCDQPNLILRSYRGDDYSSQKSVSSSQVMGSPKLPFPFLQNLLDNMSSPSKKVMFTYDNKKQYLKHITNQI